MQNECNTHSQHNEQISSEEEILDRMLLALEQMNSKLY